MSRQSTARRGHICPGSTAVVTGAASGIGRALAVELAARGVNLALSDVDGPGLERTVDMCAAGAGRAGAGSVGTGPAGSAKIVGYHLDVADRAAVLDHAATVVASFPSVDLVVNNAGVAVAATVEETSFEDIDWLLGINLFGVINGTKAFLPYLLASGGGAIVNISSVFGLIAPPTQSAYCAAKFAVRGYTESLRQEMLMAGEPVSVHCVHPGGIRTNIARNARISAPPDPSRDPVGDFDRIARTTPEKAARVILAGVDAGKARILVGADAYALAAMARVMGSGYQSLFARAGRRLLDRRAAAT